MDNIDRNTMLLYNLIDTYVSIVQWIEQSPPKGQIQVRSLLGIPLLTRKPRKLRITSFYFFKIYSYVKLSKLYYDNL